jgi:hypothetical protein
MSHEIHSKNRKNEFLKIIKVSDKYSAQKAHKTDKEEINLHNRKNKMHISQRWNLQSVTSNSIIKQKTN